METFDADLERMVAIELKEKLLTLYAGVLPLWSTVNTWKLNDVNTLLPAPFDVRVAIEQYRTLRVERLLLQDTIASFLKAEIGDTLTDQTLPGGSWPLIFNEELIFSPSLIF